MIRTLLLFFIGIFFLSAPLTVPAQDEADDVAEMARQAAGLIEELEKKLADPDLPTEERLKIEKRIAGGYLVLQEVEKAILHLRKAFELQEDPSEEDYLELGGVLLQADQFEEAAEVLSKGQEKFPDSMNIASLLTYPLTNLEKWEEAAVQFEKIEESVKGTPRGLNSDFYFRYGAAVERAGDIEKAAQLFQTCLERIPPTRERVEFQATVLNYLGYMWIENDMNLDVAGELVKKAAKLNPDSGEIADSLGWFYFKKGRYIEAMTELVRAETLMEDTDPVILDHIARTYAKIGKKDQAVAYMERALKLDPENEEFRKRLEDFGKLKVDAEPVQ